MSTYHSKILSVLLSWIAGIIVITIYTHTDAFMTDLSNASPERFYNSFEGAVWLNVSLAILGPLFIAIIIPIFICCLVIKKNRKRIRINEFRNLRNSNEMNILFVIPKKNRDNFQFYFYSDNRLNNINILWVDCLVWVPIYLGRL